MAITISFTGGAEKRSLKQKNQGVENLLALLAELPNEQLILLDTIGADFHFHNRKKDSGASDYPKRTIEQSLIEFTRFTFKDRDKPSHNQRWAMATLKEEVIHYLAEHLGFDRSRQWKQAAAQELSTPNSYRKKLLKELRKYDSSEDEIKLSPEEYTEDITLLDRVKDALHGEWEPGEELLVNLLLAKNYLKAKSYSDDEVQQKMEGAFPYTYALALQFEEQIQQEAEKIAGTSEQQKVSAQESIEKLQRSWEEVKNTTSLRKR